MVYGREYDGKTLSFEPSGGLREASLVMRDRETDSWWSIISGDAIGGSLKGRKLTELAVGEKARWGDWKRRYPQTLVLSVEGKEYDPVDYYADYFKSDETFRNTEVEDPRLPGKEPIYAFRLGGRYYAAPHSAIEGGVSAVIGGTQVFLFRAPGGEMLQSTAAFVAKGEPDAGAVSPRFQRGRDGWRDATTRKTFDPMRDEFPAGGGVERLAGFDTFWYMWANINPVVLLSPGTRVGQLVADEPR